MTPSSPDPDLPVDEIMRRWPETIRVMIRHQMLCIGCPLGIFHTVTDAAVAHEVDEAAFTAELLTVIRLDSSTKIPSAFEEEAEAPVRNI
jgi:hybrid cluster-associated redox disulfide protein|tara:strand:- start:1264 stop:1533 length:270 start_codon:yes stop_codon:yes gene_type:complete